VTERDPSLLERNPSLWKRAISVRGGILLCETGQDSSQLRNLFLWQRDLSLPVTKESLSVRERFLVLWERNLSPWEKGYRGLHLCERERSVALRVTEESMYSVKETDLFFCRKWSSRKRVLSVSQRNLPLVLWESTIFLCERDIFLC
jgi:hypothetical protein